MDIMRTQTIREYNRLLIENIVQRVIDKSYINGICNELLDSALLLHNKPEIAVLDNILNSSLDSDIFLSGLGEEAHPLPNSSDYWLLDKIQESRPEYISPDLFDEQNESTVTPPTAQTQLWNEEYFQNIIQSAETETSDNSKFIYVPQLQITGVSSANVNDVYKGCKLDMKEGSVSYKKSKNLDLDHSETIDSYCEKVVSSQSNSFPSMAKKIKLDISINDDLEIGNTSHPTIDGKDSDTLNDTVNKEIDNELIQGQSNFENFNDVYKDSVDAEIGSVPLKTSKKQNEDPSYINNVTKDHCEKFVCSQPNNFPISAEKAKFGLSIDNDIKSGKLWQENLECGDSDSLIDIFEDNIGNERFQSISSLDSDLVGKDEIKENYNFLSDDYSIPMTFDSSVDLIWKLKKAEILPSNDPINSQRPGKYGKIIETSKTEITKRTNQVIKELRTNNYNTKNREKMDIVPEGFECINNDHIEFSMYDRKDEKERLSQSKIVESKKRDSTKSSDKVLGTPPHPQQGLCLLHRAPRIGLSRLQSVLTLHPKIKK